MNKFQNEAMLTLAVLITRHQPLINPHLICMIVAKLQRLAVSLRKRYEASCSYEWACTEAYETQTGKLEARAMSLVAELGVKLELQRDPRGWPMIFTVAGREERLG